MQKSTNPARGKINGILKSDRFLINKNMLQTKSNAKIISAG